jgi:hypothetical protein
MASVVEQKHADREYETWFDRPNILYVHGVYTFTSDEKELSSRN